jgi:peroxiredoxin
MSALAVGDPAPDVRLLDLDGTPTRLSWFWHASPAVFVFLRYFGCPFCQAQVVALRRDRERFEDAGARVVLVGHGDRDAATTFAERKALPFPLLLDPDRSAYRAYGLVPGRAVQVLGPKVVLPWLKAELSSETRQRGLKGGDFFQMPGTFVIDRGGVVRLAGALVRLAHRNRHVADTPSNEMILRLVHALREEAQRAGTASLADAEGGDEASAQK